MAAAALALFALSSSEVSALSLGRITVQSALGEPLRAEVDIPSITAEEAASLKTSTAPPAAFVAAGLEYNAAMTGLQATLARKADGRAYLRLTSDRPINDPFVDMILVASWSSGRIVRDYTMLFDPPSLKQAVPAPTLAQTAPATTSVPAKVAAAPTQATDKPAPAPKAMTEPAESGQVTVKPGDSASKLARRNKTSDVSLDQMLVALLRNNPDAFIKGNLNLLRAGAVVDLPSEEDAKAIPADEAAQTVIAQSKDFNEFRRNLASNAPTSAVDAPDRKAAGSVEAKVEDKKPASNAADKLTLSKGALQSKAEETKIAKERADKDAADRAAEIAKNIADLKALSVASAASAAKVAPGPAAATASPTASSPASIAPSVELPVAVASAPVASEPNTAAAPAMPASAATPAKPPAPVVADAAEPSLLDTLLEDPMLPLAGGGLIAALGGLAFYRRQKAKKRAAHVDSSFLDSHLQPESFFGASGGQQVDTAEGGASSSSMSYKNSQIGSADDVDPVAEADVYLAYGRDAQAEEILKEAARSNPGRLAIHSKLLDVYAKRADPLNFQASATTALQLTGPDSPEWARICQLGQSIDPGNPLYGPGGAAEPLGSVEPGGDTMPVASLAEVPHANSDLDLDLDFSAEEASAAAPASPDFNDFAAQQTVKMTAEQVPDSNGLDFDVSGPGELEPTPAPDAQATALELPQGLPDLSFAMDGLSLESRDPADPVANAIANLDSLPEVVPPLPEPAPAVADTAPPANANEGMLEFDLGSLSLDLGPEVQPPTEEEGSAFGDDSLETKLALAEEFVSIGDQDGARALIEEVVAEATGELREKAQRALAGLS